MMFNITFFVFLGAVFPWRRYYDMGVGYLILTAALVLLFRRLPFMMAARRLIPQIKSNREAFFCGWFGPMGVGAIFFAMVCFQTDGLDVTVKYNVFTVVTFVVLASIVIHGITVPITHISLKTKAKRKLKKQQQQKRETGSKTGGATDTDTAADTDLPDLPTTTSGDTSDLEANSSQSQSSHSHSRAASPSISPISSSDLPSILSHTHATTAQEMNDAIKEYEADPYAETLDMRGLLPHEIIKKIYGNYHPTGGANGGANADAVVIPIQTGTGTGTGTESGTGSSSSSTRD